jgi:hypothetical protein
MAKKMSKIARKVESSARANQNDDAQFQSALNSILKKVKNQKDLQEKINQLKRDENKLAGILTQQQQNILNTTLRRATIHQNIRAILTDESKIYGAIMGSLRSIYNYLGQNDEYIKNSALNLGLSRNLSDQYRDNLIESAKYAASLGLSVKNLADIQEAYTKETGQSAILTEKALNAVTLMTQGTSMSAENVGTLVGQFKLLGYNAENTKDFVQLTADESQKLGVNFNKVLGDISGNFDKIQSFNFQNGINGVQKMAMYANMYKINMNSAFASMEKSRTLEGAVEMSAKLMVMGGEFSKQNMFELAFLSRNKPEEYMKKMNEMTRSTYFFNKQTGEFQASAFDLDRLRAVSEATGIPFEEMTKSARRLAEIDFAKTKMLSGLSADDKDFVANMAEFNKSSGKFEIQLGSDVLDIKNIGKQQIEALKGQKASLEQRALDSATFDKAFTNTVEELKSVLLPTIKFMNDALRWIQEFGAVGKFVIITGIGAGVALVVKGLSLVFTGTLNVVLNGFLARLQAILSTSSIGGAGGAAAGGGSAGGKGFMGKLGGAAGGAMAVGGAFLAASYGIKMIAESFKELNSDQLNAITAAIVTMGISIPASLFAISSAGMAATVAAPGLATLALVISSIGVAALGLGFGVQLAATGLGNMFSKITPEIAESINKIGWGFGKMGIGLATFANPLTIAGMTAFSIFLTSLSFNKDNLANLSGLATSMATGTQGFIAFGNAIDKISMINNDKTIAEIRGLINDLNNMEMINPITELKEILSKPLKVEFADQNVNMVVNVSSILDGKVLAKNIYPHLAKLIRNNAQNK